MLNNIYDTAPINVWRWMWLMATDHSLLLWMYELATRACVLQHLVAQMFEDGLELIPLEIRGRWRRAKPLEGFLMLGH